VIWGNSSNADRRDGKDWQRATIEYPLWYGDYGGTAKIDFYIKDASPYHLVLVFMGGAANEKLLVLDSVSTTSK